MSCLALILKRWRRGQLLPDTIVSVACVRCSRWRDGRQVPTFHVGDLYVSFYEATMMAVHTWISARFLDINFCLRNDKKVQTSSTMMHSVLYCPIFDRLRLFHSLPTEQLIIQSADVSISLEQIGHTPDRLFIVDCLFKCSASLAYQWFSNLPASQQSVGRLTKICIQ